MAKQNQNRSAGVLLPLTMLPGPFGIGVMGKEARDFVDFLAEGGFSLWQMLPIEHMGESYSPYKGISAFAGDPMLIDPLWLFDQGWITERELDDRCEEGNPHSIDYQRVYDKQMVLLRAAFSRVSHRCREEYGRFQPFWLEHYALYMALKEQYQFLPWFLWPDEELRHFESVAVGKASREHRTLQEFYRFVQWVFDCQWQALKQYAGHKGISFMGDIPFYVSEDSVEVWSCREMFAVDQSGEFIAVAGAPPDYFTPEGQTWGNPLFHWEHLEKDGYGWWIERMKVALDRFDCVRMDHFRGFESYWAIPVSAQSAKEGAWIKGPGIRLFRAMEQVLGPLPVVAEDLGIIGPEVEALLDQTGFYGMKVLQFGFLGDERHLPHHYETNQVAYTGTHDNTTLLAWLYEMREEDRTRVLFYCGYEGDWGKGGANCGICEAWIRLLYLSAAAKVIVPIQDLLGYGADTRTNIPGTSQGNWHFRVTKEALQEIDIGFYRKLAEITDRCPKM